MRVFGAAFCDSLGSEQPGEILSVSNAGICVSCADGALLLTEIQFDGKKRMPVSEYLKGNKIELGVILGKTE